MGNKVNGTVVTSQPSFVSSTTDKAFTPLSLLLLQMLSNS